MNIIEPKTTQVLVKFNNLKTGKVYRNYKTKDLIISVENVGSKYVVDLKTGKLTFSYDSVNETDFIEVEADVVIKA